MERPGCEYASESFPDEGDKVEVISRALIQYDSPRSATLCSQARRAKEKEDLKKMPSYLHDRHLQRAKRQTVCIEWQNCSVCC